MFGLSKRIEIAGMHCLELPYASPCTRPHGHNWIITVEVQSEQLNADGMVVDLTRISKLVKTLDHTIMGTALNELTGLRLNPTAENIAFGIFSALQNHLVNDDEYSTQHACVSKVTVQESEGNVAWYQNTSPSQ